MMRKRLKEPKKQLPRRMKRHRKAKKQPSEADEATPKKPKKQQLMRMKLHKKRASRKEDNTNSL